MSTGLALLVFAVSLGATLYAASVFAERLDVLGHRLQLPEALALEGGVALAITAVVALLVFGVLPAWATVLLCVLVLVPYGIVVSVAEGDRPKRLSLRQWRHLRRSLGGKDRREPVARREVLGPMLVIPPAVAAIVLGSIGMVHSALTLADRWGLPDAVVGAVLLAVLTSLPNAYTGIRLGRARRGAALVSETMNSNTINLVGGLAIPALFVTVGGFSALAVVDFSWLLLMTAVAVLLLARRIGMGMRGGILLVAAWIGFAVVQGIWG